MGLTPDAGEDVNPRPVLRDLGGRSIMVRSINWSDVKRKVEEMTWVSNPALSAERAVSDPVRKVVAKR